MPIRVRKALMGGHVHMDVFVGATEDSGALAGHLVLREDESKEVEQALTVERYICPCGKIYSKVGWDRLDFCETNFLTTNEDGSKIVTLEIKFCVVCGSKVAAQVAL